MTVALAPALATTARVVGVERIGEYQVLAVREPEVTARTEPGQFVNLAAGTLLRRPFSVFRAGGDVLSVAFDVLGPGTRWLAARRLGDAVDLVGPLGTAFTVEGEGPVLCVGGGYGAAPLFLLAERMRAAGREVHAIIGAARAARVFAPGLAEAVFDSLVVTTEDGSLGVPGRVTDVLTGSVAATKARAICACGPMPMLAAVSALSIELGVGCEVAVEEFMACGIGVCWTCVVPVSANGDTGMLRSCTEGPVFDGAAVEWG